MAELPPPSTTSPGKLKLRYTLRGQVHEVGTNLISGTDITDTATLATQAGLLAARVQPLVTNAVTIDAWKLTDRDDVTLFEEPFEDTIVGTYDGGGGSVVSDSATWGLTGKGQPEIGLKAGQTRFTFFPGVMVPAIWANPQEPITPAGQFDELQLFLNTSAVLGADYYGSPGNWRSYVVTQINAHFQRKLGF